MNRWNANGNWLLTASRDHLLKLFDIRNTKEEIQTFRGHKKEASTIAWHPGKLDRIGNILYVQWGSEYQTRVWMVENNTVSIEQLVERSTGCFFHLSN